MAASFLQYCAMCEKQITTPSNSILYCSQACSRKDEAKPLSASILPPHAAELSPRPSSTSGSRSSSPSPKPATATTVGPRSPPSITTSATPAVRIPSDQHAHKADLDPTEWKPKLRRPGLGRAAHMRHSEAYRYLASFHTRMAAHGEGDSSSQIYEAGNGTAAHKYSSSMYNMPTLTMPLPSLSSTPTTTASSLDDGASWEYNAYDFNTRPLQARSNPLYAVRAGVNVEELVTPFVAPKSKPVTGGFAPADDAHGGSVVTEDFWGKKTVVKVGVAGPKREGLGKLLGGSRI